MSKRTAAAKARSLKDLLHDVKLAHLPPVALDDILEGLPEEILGEIVGPPLAVQLVQEPVSKTLAVVARAQILRYFRRTVAQGIEEIRVWGAETSAFMPAFVAPLAAVCRVHDDDSPFGTYDLAPVPDRRIPLAWFLRNAPDAAGAAMDEGDWDAILQELGPESSETLAYVRFLRMRPMKTFVDLLLRASAVFAEGKPLHASFSRLVSHTELDDEAAQRRKLFAHRFWSAVQKRWCERGDAEVVYWLTYFRSITPAVLDEGDSDLITPELFFAHDYLEHQIVRSCFALWCAPRRVRVPELDYYFRFVFVYSHWAITEDFQALLLPASQTTRDRLKTLDIAQEVITEAPLSSLEAEVARTKNSRCLTAGAAYYYDWMWTEIAVRRVESMAASVVSLFDSGYDWLALFRRGLRAPDASGDVEDSRGNYCLKVLLLLRADVPSGAAVCCETLYRVVDLLTDTELQHMGPVIKEFFDRVLAGADWTARAAVLAAELSDFSARDARLRKVFSRRR